MESVCESTRCSPVRTASREAKELLGQRHVLPLLTLALLFLITVAFAAYCLVQFLVFLAVTFVVSDTAAAVLEPVLVVTELLLLIALVMPVWLGKLRLAGLLCVGEEPQISSVLYYFTSRERYFRALRTSALTALLLILPAFAVAGLFLGAVSLYHEVLTYYFGGPLAVLLFFLLLLLALLLSVSIIFFSGAYLFFAPVAVGNENLRVRHAFALAVRGGRKNLAKTFVFSLRSLLLLALSLLTVGVLYVLWFSHYYTLSYMRLAMALCPKEEAK